MIARSNQSALVALLVLVMLGLATPLTAQAHGRDSYSHGYRQMSHDNDDDGSRYVAPRHHGWRHHRDYDYYAPRYYPDVVIYPQVAPRVYYYEPEPVYPREYGTVGIHLDYNLLY